MSKLLLLVLALLVVIALVVLVVPASGQPGSNSAAPGVSAGGPEMPAGGPPGGKPAGPPGMGGVPKGSHVDAPSDPVKAAPKVGLILGIAAVLAIGVALVIRKKST